MTLNCCKSKQSILISLARICLSLLTVRASLEAKPALIVIGILFSLKKSFNSSGLKFTSRKVTLPKVFKKLVTSSSSSSGS